MNSYLSAARARAEAGIDRPVSDIAYCDCGCMWNIAAMEDMHFDADFCPDCGERPIFIEKGSNDG